MSGNSESQDETSFAHAISAGVDQLRTTIARHLSGMDPVVRRTLAFSAGGMVYQALPTRYRRTAATMASAIVAYRTITSDEDARSGQAPDPYTAAVDDVFTGLTQGVTMASTLDRTDESRTEGAEIFDFPFPPSRRSDADTLFDEGEAAPSGTTLTIEDLLAYAKDLELDIENTQRLLEEHRAHVEANGSSDGFIFHRKIGEFDEWRHVVRDVARESSLSEKLLQLRDDDDAFGENVKMMKSKLCNAETDADAFKAAVDLLAVLVSDHAKSADGTPKKEA